MPHRFHITSTNYLIQLANNREQDEFQQLSKINHQIQDLILKFNLGVENSFLAGGMQGLEASCTPAGLERMQEKYVNWTNQQVKALNLVSCDFLSFDLAPDQKHAAAFTFEKWVFVYLDGSEVHTTGSIDGYDLRQINGQWVVDSVIFYAPNTDPH